MGNPKKPIGELFFFNLLMWCLKKDVLKIKYLKCYEMKNKQTNEALAFKEHYFKSKRKMTRDPVSTWLLNLLTNSN